ncbi:MAG: hypothetical protein KIT07_05915 [Anaerolineales bacterium]|nr:hypothetical protein [Anaerolineales bacterium]
MHQFFENLLSPGGTVAIALLSGGVWLFTQAALGGSGGLRYPTWARKVIYVLAVFAFLLGIGLIYVIEKSFIDSLLATPSLQLPRGDIRWEWSLLITAIVLLIARAVYMSRKSQPKEAAKAVENLRREVKLVPVYVSESMPYLGVRVDSDCSNLEVRLRGITKLGEEDGQMDELLDLDVVNPKANTIRKYSINKPCMFMVVRLWFGRAQIEFSNYSYTLGQGFYYLQLEFIEKGTVGRPDRVEAVLLVTFSFSVNDANEPSISWIEMN